MQIQRIPFPPIGSNMYVVTQGRDAIVLDPWPDEATMQRLQGYHTLLVLTHEHVDHISGLGRMQRALSARTLWQENCTPWLRNPGNTTLPCSWSAPCRFCAHCRLISRSIPATAAAACRSARASRPWTGDAAAALCTCTADRKLS